MLGLDSIRGRYLLSASLFALFALAAGWIAQIMVNQAAQQSSENTSERVQVNRLINDLSDDIWLAESTLQGFLLTPDRLQYESTVQALAHLKHDVEVLIATPWSQRDRSRPDKLAVLQKNVSALHDQSLLLMEIRADAEKLFPAMRHMLDKMLPVNIEFSSQATLAIDEAGEMLQRGAPRQQEILRLFSEVRYSWSQMIGSFRVFLATRFGVFPGEPEEGMKIQSAQVDFHHENVNRHLAILSGIEARGELEFQQSEALARMRKINADWYEAYLTAKAIYTSERWRSDIPLLRDTIRPLFSRIWVDIGIIRGELDSGSAIDMTSLANVASSLSRSLWVISLVTILVTLGGYVFFEYVVRRPISQVAAGLNAEARGLSAVALPQPSTNETRNLVDAFEQMRTQVHSRQQRLQTILENTAEGIITFDRFGTIESCNAAARNLFGWIDDEIVGTSLHQLVVSDQPSPPNAYLERFLQCQFSELVGQEGEVTGRRNAIPFPMTIKIGAMQLDGQPFYTALVADISERKAIIEHLRDLAEHDDLTGLHNRSYFMNELERVVERARRNQQDCTLLYIDLDNFKYVNDTLGHLAGDRLLVEVSQLLEKRSRRGDLISRLGGDEFTMLLYGTRAVEARHTADSFRRSLEDYRFLHEGELVNIGCSIGAATITSKTRSAEEALAHADFACHLAKRYGRNRVHVFEKQDEANVAALSLDMGWSRRIRDAIRENRLVLATQPIVNLRDRTTHIQEVLVRLNDLDQEIVMPDGFLPSAERFGLAFDIDCWVIRNAIRLLARQRRSAPDLCFSINLSGQSLSQPEVAEVIISELAREQLDPAALIFEVTETAAIADMTKAVAFLETLRKLGCKTALDDFGSGMSSFAYLRDMPVDFVKIDGRFVRNISENSVDQAMVRAMNDIAHAMGKITIAEYVECEECLIKLYEMGLDYAQGFHLGKPALLHSPDPVTTGKTIQYRL